MPSLIRTHLFRVITNYHCWLSHATKKLKRSVALHQNEEALNELDASGELSVGDSGSGRTLFLRRVVNSRLGRYEVAVQLLSSLIDEGNFISVALAEIRHIYF